MTTHFDKRILSVTILLSVLTVGCSEVGFDKSTSSSVGKTSGPTTDGSGGANGSVYGSGPSRDGNGSIDTTTTTPCTTQVQALTYPVKIIFVLDASGSNVKGETTDPRRNLRYYSILSFLTKFANKTNFSYQMIHFQDLRDNQTPKALTYIANASNTPVFSHVNDMKNALQWFMTNVQDNGLTPYGAALVNTRQVIAGGGPDAPNTRYAVVFVTDGMPTDYQKWVLDPTNHSLLLAEPDNQGRYLVVDEQPILNDVLNTIRVKPGITTFSTVYYGRNGAFYSNDAKTRLRRMAETGGGHFVDASMDQNILIEDTLSLPGVTCNR